jgi:site-specific DNA-methyltransferase (adenine-specific)
MKPETHHTIINGDSRQMTELKNNAVHLVITSPPIGSLKIMVRQIKSGFMTVMRVTSTT